MDKGEILVEYLDIVDEEGNYTGEVLEREEVHKKNLLHNEISIFVVNDKGEVLLEKRSPNKKQHPNKWGTVAGHVGHLESLFDAALRELEEEIGLSVSKEQLVPLLDRIIYKRETNSHFSYRYYVVCNLKEKEFILQKEEVSMVKWVPIAELIERIKKQDEMLAISEKNLKCLEELKRIMEES